MKATPMFLTIANSRENFVDVDVLLAGARAKFHHLSHALGASSCSSASR